MTVVVTFAALFAGQVALPQPAPIGPSITHLEATSAPAATGADTTGEKLAVGSLPDDRLTVAVDVGDHGPFRFLVDTGADRSAISSELAARLDLPAGRAARLHSVTGLSTVRTATVRGMRIASRTLPEVNAPLLKAEHVGADGILGTDVLRSSMVRFDFARRELSIAPTTLRARSNDDDNTIVVEARRRSGRLIVTEAEIDGQRLTVVLDTGSEISIGNEALRRALARRRQLIDERPVLLKSVTGSVLAASYMVARQVEIGSVSMQGLGIAFADAHTFKAMGIEGRPALLLGMNALRAFESVTIDMAAKKLRFVMPPGAARRALFAATAAKRVGG